MPTPNRRVLRVPLDFEYGGTVYHRVANEKLRGVITGWQQASPESPLAYIVSWGDGREGVHFGVELSSEFIPDYVEEQ